MRRFGGYPNLTTKLFFSWGRSDSGNRQPAQFVHGLTVDMATLRAFPLWTNLARRQSLAAGIAIL